MIILRPLEATLAGICGLLAIVILYQTTHSPDTPKPDPLPFVAHIIQPQTAFFSPPSEAAFDIIDQRPIFIPGRKPVDATAVSGGPGKTALAPPNATLVGIISDTQKQLALIKTQGSPFANSVSVGMSVEGWMVGEIASDHVVLRAGTARFTLTMNGTRASQIGAGQSAQLAKPSGISQQNVNPPPTIMQPTMPMSGRQNGTEPSGQRPSDRMGKYQ